MRIDKRLNIVVTVDTDEGAVFVHSTPISREVFERYFLVISKTFASIYQEGLNFIAGPRIAMLMLRDTAAKMGVLEGPQGVDVGLIAEMRRLTNVLIPDKEKGGWQRWAFDDVVRRGMLLSPDDVSEVEGILAFFTCASSMHRRGELEVILAGMTRFWEAPTTSLTFTEYADSLQTSTAEPTIPTTTSLVPS